VEVDELFEGSTPLARRLGAAGPFPEPMAMIEAAYAALGDLDEADKIDTINAHPRIGENPASLSRLSRAEQGDDVRPELARLNAAYEARFGFRFVVFVNGRPKSEIVEVLKERMNNDRDQELAAGLRAVVDIARARLGA